MRAVLLGDGIILQDLKVENTAGPEPRSTRGGDPPRQRRPRRDQLLPPRRTTTEGLIDKSGIMSREPGIGSCNIIGIEYTLHTLYAHRLRRFYRDFAVSSTADFVFGNAAALLPNCSRSRRGATRAWGQTDPNQNTGTSVHWCRVVPTPDLAPPPARQKFPTFLGRPWKEYSQTVYMLSYLDSHVDPKEWLEWDGDFALRTLFYSDRVSEPRPRRRHGLPRELARVDK
ncbi:hypothetical protein E2562_027895 [Oryza meyeriana var. granulata]|uniref:Pectinesterase catalytic domain-containing protein n=1 Tax=Oryza meyeriana var. granulata TaxID=110450 RepID=A0A6G1CTQ1_9ORYZ|nr:hypothetical protein E2562_027895 [Oryza meyeriana var. granulata]